jgi:hypothetical protein
MSNDPNSEETTSANGDGIENSPDTADRYRNPRATRKGPDMPGDHDGHRIDPDTDYARPDGSERRP